ncbi:MAG: AAA domain-containing protein, partial [Oligoflexus sp.]
KLVSSAAARIIAILDGAQDPLQSRPRSSTEYTLSMEDYKAITPGGRHDNDKTDYREIDIVPTPDEVSCQQLPFLPTPNDKWPMLDRLFRLMREDMVATLKEKIKLLAPKPGSQSKRLRGYSPAKLEGITFDKFNTWSFKISFALPENHPTATMKKSKEKEEYWELGRGKKSLTRNTLVMIAHAESPDKPLLIGEIVTRNAADLASESPSIGVRFANLEALKRAISIAKSPPDGALILVSVNIALFMYSPVLSRLKSMPLVPFLEELDDQVPQLRQSPEFAAIVAPILQQLESGYPPTVPGLEGTLDPGQLEGAKMALRQRVTLIQGPPGTGKTYIGTYIAHLLTRAPQNLRILCVTYTNPAVDDFCEGLIKCGITRL